MSDRTQRDKPFENFDGRLLRGWASSGNLNPIRLRIVANGVTFNEVLPDEPREDIVAAGFALTACGFSIEIPKPLFADGPCLIEIFNCDGGAEIPGSPVQIEAQPPETAAPESLAKVPDAVAQPLASRPAPALRGHIDGFDGSALSGWASDGTRQPPRLRVLTNGAWHCEVLADGPRG